MQNGSNTFISTTKFPADVVLLDGAGNQITAFGGSGGTSHGDDSAFTIGSASSVTPAGFLADETATDSVDEGDVGVARMTLARKVLTVISDQDTETHADVIALAGFHPLAVAIVDAAGVQIASFGGGQQYTEDAAAAANPVGTVPILVRTDTPAGQVSADGDNIAQRGTNFGAAFVQVVDSSGAFVNTFGGGVQYTEDAASAANPVGNALILVRDDAPAGLVSANQDNIAARGTNAGEMYVKHLDTMIVNGSGVTQPVSAASLPLPTGASTAAKQPALGTAGAASADVITVQGIAGMTKLLVTPDSVALPANQSVNVAQINGVTPLMGAGNTGTGSPRVTIATDQAAIPITVAAGAATIAKAEDAASVSADVGVPAMAIQLATPADLAGTDADYAMLQMSAGRLWASVKVDTALPTGANAIGKLAANSGVDIGDVDVTTVGTITPGTAATSLGKAEDAGHTSGDVGVMALVVRNDTRGTLAGTDLDYAPLQLNASGDLRVDASAVTLTVAAHAVTNAGTFVVQENGSQVQVDDAAFTPATSKIVMAGFEADESSTDSVDEGDGGAARMTLDRKQIVTVAPHTAGGCLIALMSSADGSTALTNAAQAIKASAGQLYGWYIYNPNAAATYVSIYNVAAASVTVGTTNPAMTLCIPATSAANILGAVGIEFLNAGFSAAATTTGGGNTAPTTALEATFFYK
jgi:hypothetical protein